MPSRAGRLTAKVLGIKLQDAEPYRDEATFADPVLSGHNGEAFVEEPPTVADFLAGLRPSKSQAVEYIFSLFPFLSWIGHYNLQWLIGDLVAGITIGAVVVPQGMAYAKLAKLEVQFGLYSSFMGVLVYWFFATSKDITIGPVAVLSQVTGGIVADMKTALPDVPGHVIASALALLAGTIVLFIGLLRCGWIVDMIPLTALSAFMAGSALTIISGQIPAMMGISGVSTNDPPYLVFIHTLKGLRRSTLDAAMGLSALTMLYLIRGGCSYIGKRWLKHQRLAFFLSTLRVVFVIVFYTFISFLVNRGLPESEVKFNIVLDVPRGFQNAAVPVLNQRIAGHLVGYLPATVIVLLIEHIAISKSFGRINNYTINPSQEMVGIGVTNILGPFLGGYAATGSFSRTAIKSKAGVRTPFAGVITAAVVLLAIYFLPSVFYYIPNASLAAVIIHAVGDLITPPDTIYRFWLVSPFEVVIFFVGIIVTVFSSIESGIYCTILLSATMLLFRTLRARGRFLGRVKGYTVVDDQLLGADIRQSPVGGTYGTFGGSPEAPYRNIFLPITHADGSNPEVELSSPYPGVFIYRFSEGFNYPNASHSLEWMTRYIFSQTRRTHLTRFERLGDRPWNDPGPSRRKLKAASSAGAEVGAIGMNMDLPTLKAVILDFSSVNHVDITSVQQLIDVRNQLDRYASPEPVDWHIACINNRWTKRALVSAGFGYPTPDSGGLQRRWLSIFSVAEIGGSQSAAAAAEKEVNEKEFGPGFNASNRQPASRLAEVNGFPTTLGSRSVDNSAVDLRVQFGVAEHGNRDPRAGRTVAVHGLNRPLFHVDLTSALQSAIANVEARDDVDTDTETRAGGISWNGTKTTL
ncbi:hypothetical protein OQA88_4099 [Cercophora sp. LCS_1]